MKTLLLSSTSRIAYAAADAARGAGSDRTAKPGTVGKALAQHHRNKEAAGAPTGQDALKVAEQAKAAPPTQAEKALSAVLETIQREGRQLESNGTARVAKAVLVYLEERQHQAGNAKITVTEKQLRDHCYDLVNYKATTRGDQGEDTSSPAFEACVRRGVEAALLMFNEVNGIHIPPSGPHAGKIVAPANKIIPFVKAKMQGNKSVDVANPSSELIPVPVKLLEATFREEFPEARAKGNKGAKPSRTPHHNDTGTDKPKARGDLAALPLGVIMLELIARFASIPKGKQLEGTEREIGADLMLQLDRLMEDDGADEAPTSGKEVAA